MRICNFFTAFNPIGFNKTLYTLIIILWRVHVKPRSEEYWIVAFHSLCTSGLVAVFGIKVEGYYRNFAGFGGQKATAHMSVG